MNISVLIAATRARLALLIAGLAWFVGLDAPAPVRIAIAGLVLAALVFDGAVDEGRVRTEAASKHQNRPHSTV
ncbi:hypothetical protein [Streptomyces sp. 891-h]|uniref:hypothetical protein n=1 Tax=Streptomyces sp. 891-h TaxID=2720714 RepID=UPI001FAAD58B|nr:hypothetical protein [Streptomyces sp. 891-h]UNZ20607.1 hypothetical protein HC362_29625 [Streptomyces sp. 891-h]